MSDFSYPRGKSLEINNFPKKRNAATKLIGLFVLRFGKGIGDFGG